ncbi:MAG TPA: alpha/beta fold hydrolase [Steroidobacteraceae bacterium]|nr:alpha/beta fold hydrolase [Steroidobacteraceae bacterium]
MDIDRARLSRIPALAGAALLLTGCATVIAPRIIAPQPGGLQRALSKSRAGTLSLEDIDAYISAHRRFDVGPPPATLSVAVVPPGRYRMMFGNRQPADCMALYLIGAAQARLQEAIDRVCRAEHHITAAKHGAAAGRPLSCTPPPLSPATLQSYRTSIAALRGEHRPRGTVILLPGYGIGKLSMLPWALLLGRAGYQSILVDMRAEGQSTGRSITYGALESTDLVQLVPALRRAGLIRGRLGLLGDSMGAATALLAAPHIPDLHAVVAISPYPRATTAIPRYARLAYWYAHLVPSWSWKAAQRKAGRIAGVSLAEAAPIETVSEIHAPVLYVQGGRDRVISSQEAHRLAARTPDSDLLMYPTLGHLQLSEDYAQLAQPVIDWYNRHLAQVSRQAPPPKTGPPPRGSFPLTVCVHY